MRPLTTMTEVGRAVREARRARGWTQTQLAHRMGVAQSYVSRLEAGGARLAGQYVLDAFVALEVPLMTSAGPDHGDGLSKVATRDRSKLPDPDDDPFADVNERL